jgi:hypothetical protein
MPIVIQPYRPEHEPAVAEFNQRLRQAGQDANTVFFKYAEPRWLPRKPESRIYNEFFVAVDNGVVRGGYALKTQDFLFPDGSVRPIAYYHHPLSEGIVNKSHAIVGTLLLRDAMQRAPLLYCLGMGGYENPLPQMLIKLGWAHCAVPFFFRVVNARKFLRQMQPLRTSIAGRVAMDVAAFSGAGWLGSKMFQRYRAAKAPGVDFGFGDVNRFGLETSELWEAGKSECSFTAVRNVEALTTLYPSTETHLTRVEVARSEKMLGWAVVGERRKDPKYGDLRVGSVVDCWAIPGEAFAVVMSATKMLEQQGFDLILTNQSHQKWCETFRTAGYLAGPSNFILAASKKLAALLEPFDQIRPRMHFTRADGDGLPKNY